MTTSRGLPGDAAKADLPPSLLATYAFERWLGRGATSVVYLGRQTSLGRRVVVKVLSRYDPEMGERFLREARVLAGLRHPAIVGLLDFGTAGERLYMTYAYEQGRTLATVLEEKRSLSWRDSAAIARRLAEALAEAHGKGIVHRDLKPGNVLIGDDGEAKLLDFGFSRELGSTLTADGEYIGTPAYSAPEHCHSGQCDALSDIYSLGVVLYELLTGENPFRGGSTLEALNLQLTVHVDSFPPSAPDVPEELRALVLEMLEKGPGDRPASAALVAARLGTLLGDSSAPARAAAAEALPGGSAVQPAPLPAKPRPPTGTVRLPTQEARVPAGEPQAGRRWLAVVAVLAVLAFAGAAWQYGWQVVPSPQAPPRQERGGQGAPAAPAGRAVRAALTPAPELVTFELSPAGRVRSVRFTLASSAQARLEEETGGQPEWSESQKIHRLHRAGIDLAGRFSIALRSREGSELRHGPFAGSATEVLENVAGEVRSLEAFPAAVGAALCDVHKLPAQQVTPRLLELLGAMGPVKAIRSLDPYFALPGSADLRLPVSQRRTLVALRQVGFELDRARLFLVSIGTGGAEVEAWVPWGVKSVLDANTPVAALATVPLLESARWFDIPPCHNDCSAGTATSPLATAAVELPPVASARRIILRLHAQYTTPLRYTRVHVRGRFAPDQPPLEQAIYLQKHPITLDHEATFLVELDPAFLACGRLELAVRTGCLPEFLGAPAIRNLSHVTSRAMLSITEALSGDSSRVELGPASLILER
ncbi:MAG: serine/threonine protein kinase [Candidatus Wallbacteria bacterium]|nr:serine/threonine protein kinase [Candidatus Wallbacteria bacterium]